MHLKFAQYVSSWHFTRLHVHCALCTVHVPLKKESTKNMSPHKQHEILDTLFRSKYLNDLDIYDLNQTCNKVKQTKPFCEVFFLFLLFPVILL